MNYYRYLPANLDIIIVLCIYVYDRIVLQYYVTYFRYSHKQNKNNLFKISVT